MKEKHGILHAPSIELSFLLKLLRLNLNNSLPPQAVPENIDWHYFLSLVNRHRVVPPVYQAVQENFPALLQGALAQLPALYRHNSMQMLAHAGELLHVNEFCQKANIPLMVFKGPVHAIEIHGGITNRQSRDLDLLTSTAYLGQIQEYLRDRGYSRTVPPAGVHKYMERFFIKEKNAYSFYHPAKKVNIELHWRLDRYFELVPISTGKLFVHQRPFILNGHSIPTLSNTYQLYYILVHGMQHGWFRLFWLYDVACMARQKELDWEAVLVMARSYKVLDAVLASFRLMELVFGAPVPKQAKNFHLSARANKLFLGSLRALQDDQEMVLSRGRGRVRKIRHLMRMKGETRFAARVIKGLFILEKDWGRLKLPPPLFWVYYLSRPVFWIYDLVTAGKKRVPDKVI